MKAILKFNNGNLALLCSQCRVIVKTGKDFTKEEMDFALMEDKHLEPVYCDKCKESNSQTNKKLKQNKYYGTETKTNSS